MAFESEALAWLRHLPLCRRWAANRQAHEGRLLEQVRNDTNRALGIVYMSGEDLSFHKLTPELLMSRVTVLRDQLDSGGLRLLSKVQGLTLREMDAAEECCGFGGTFSVKFPEVSGAMARTKIESIRKTEADAVVSIDSSCLMQLQGVIDRAGLPIRTLHLAEVLASR